MLIESFQNGGGVPPYLCLVNCWFDGNFKPINIEFVFIQLLHESLLPILVSDKALDKKFDHFHLVLNALSKQGEKTTFSISIAL